MIVDTDAVVDPWAVMVESFNTLVADTAVTRTICSNDLTVGAQQDRVKDLHHIHKENTLGPLEVARVFGQADHMEDDCQGKHA